LDLVFESSRGTVRCELMHIRIAVVAFEDAR
jgi:hypothetical protein